MVGSGEISHPATGGLLLVSSHGRGDSELSGVSSYKGTNPIAWGPA